VAITVSDVEDLLRVLREHPEWRERVRLEILGEEILSLPERLAGVERQLELLVAETRELRAGMTEIRNLTAELGRRTLTMDGKIGNLQGRLYESEFHALNRITGLYRKPETVTLADLDEVLDARDAGTISQHEFEQLQSFDFIFRARDGKGNEAPTVYPVLEVSITVGMSDVQRAYDRAALLRRVGLPGVAVVGGRFIDPEAREFAESSGVSVIVDRTSEPAH
jgi:hypothetical protein